ncbi:hypothetical protein SLEP1_g16156 [Rubroshorea leprosula]|uniref:FAD-binding PCMH-type domain-containing protein n=1 Tax=Rubroshorea leprosula TaxID=152421 RepID=A0AAV5J1L4_9ROSI|nr:hypothetical protein SLEP1_g16156 [Rubroshorea leprosula]
MACRLESEVEVTTTWAFSYVSKVSFVILDMFNLQSIHIDIAKETAWVQTGATLVGTGGHFSGGGYGVMMRKHGPFVDIIIDAQIVDAIRGGGGASFGIILSWKIKLVQIPPKVTMFNVSITLKQGANDILYQWQEVAPKLPGDLFIRAIVDNVNGTITARLQGNELAKFNPVLGWTSGGKKLRNFLQQNIDTRVGIKFMQWSPYGGRMSEILEAETPFPHRAGNLFKLQNCMVWYHDNVIKDGIKSIRELNGVMTPYVLSKPREAFLNYRDLDIGKRSNSSKAGT